jgi:hypothetical protein
VGRVGRGGTDKKQNKKMEKYQVWSEGYSATGNSSDAQRLTRKGEDTLWEGETFKDACENALRTLKWEMKYYDKDRNTYWGCRFYDNEADARKSFG